jgi:hypothetical protein
MHVSFGGSNLRGRHRGGSEEVLTHPGSEVCLVRLILVEGVRLMHRGEGGEKIDERIGQRDHSGGRGKCRRVSRRRGESERIPCSELRLGLELGLLLLSVLFSSLSGERACRRSRIGG